MPRSRPSARQAAGGLACVLLLGACGASAEEFREADPTGYDACRAFATADGAGGDVYHEAIGRAAALGLDAATPGIRARVDDRDGGAEGDPVVTDLGDFRDACEDAGFDF